MKNTNNIVQKLVKHLKKNGNKISFDFDDTLFFTSGSAINYINNHHKIIKILKENDKYPFKLEYLTDFNFLDSILGKELSTLVWSNEFLYDLEYLKPTSGVFDFIELLKKEVGVQNIQVVTAAFAPDTDVSERKDKVITEQLGLLKENIVHTNQKKEYVQGTIYFEDGFHNFDNLLDCKKTFLICMEKPWNRVHLEEHNHVLSISDYNDIIDIFKEAFKIINKKNRTKNLKIG